MGSSKKDKTRNIKVIRENKFEESQSVKWRRSKIDFKSVLGREGIESKLKNIEFANLIASSLP